MCKKKKIDFSETLTLFQLKSLPNGAPDTRKKCLNGVLIIFFRWRLVDKPLCSAWTKQPLRKRPRETSLSVAAWREGRNKGPTGEARSSCSWHVEGIPAFPCLGEVNFHTACKNQLHVANVIVSSPEQPRMTQHTKSFAYRTVAPV